MAADEIFQKVYVILNEQFFSHVRGELVQLNWVAEHVIYQSQQREIARLFSVIVTKKKIKIARQTQKNKNLIAADGIIVSF